MRKKLIPNYIMQHIQKNPQIGRIQLAKNLDIPETEARFYCRVFSEMNKEIKYHSQKYVNRLRAFDYVKLLLINLK